MARSCNSAIFSFLMVISDPSTGRSICGAAPEYAEISSDRNRTPHLREGAEIIDAQWPEFRHRPEVCRKVGADDPLGGLFVALGVDDMRNGPPIEKRLDLRWRDDPIHLPKELRIVPVRIKRDALKKRSIGPARVEDACRGACDLIDQLVGDPFRNQCQFEVAADHRLQIP